MKTKQAKSSGKEKQRVVTAVDLFCGAGGTSTGLAQACKRRGYKLRLLAINHWEIAIATHETNHTHAEHLCMNVDQVDPRKVVPTGKLDLLIASPECTHHSNARGGRPMNDQSRASAWLVLRWCEALDIKNVLIENVPEFESWGPLGTNGRPLKKRKGETFLAFLNALKSLGYNVDYKILNAANYGDPTTRRRLFILARKGRRQIEWAEPTHTPDGATTLFGKTKKWRAAREIIDWEQKGESIYQRKKPLSENTMRRIMAGLKKFGGASFIVPFFGEYAGKAPRVHDLDAPLPTVTSHGAGGLVEPFIVQLNGTKADQLERTARSVDEPMPTVVGANHLYLAEPFILNIRGGDDGYVRGASVNDPVQAITTQPALALIEPFVIGQQSGATPRSVKEPLPTIAGAGAIALVEPYIVNLEHTGANGAQVRSTKEPLPAITTAPRIGIAQPFIVPLNHGKNDIRSHDVDKPMPTITSVDAWGLCEPYLVAFHGGNGHEKRTHSVDEPVPTLDTQNRFGLAEPYLVEFHKSGEGVQSVDKPLPTQTTKDRFALVQPQAHGAVLDIRFRMLTPKEMAKAMSFPDDYKFAGNREQVVKQIGNAVAVKTAEALCLKLLD